MKNKVLIKVFVINISEEFELYVPVNESIKEIIHLIVKSLYDLSDRRINKNNTYCLLDPDTNMLYNYSLLVRNTNIVNGKKLLLI